MDELRHHVEKIVKLREANAQYRRYAAVLLNNEVWRETLAGIPYRRRLLLLPQCLRDEDNCRAELDEFGLICKHCGRCPIHDLQTEAERLGYVVLAAEGAAIVSSAVPGLSIPLLQEGCANTSVDLEWVWDAIYLNADDRTRRLELNALRDEVESWFTSESLAAILGGSRSQTEQIAQDWLTIKYTMWNYVGLVRTSKRMKRARQILRELQVEAESFYEKAILTDDLLGLRNGVQTALAVLFAALENHESLGCHYRKD